MIILSKHRAAGNSSFFHLKCLRFQALKIAQLFVQSPLPSFQNSFKFYFQTEYATFKYMPVPPVLKSLTVSFLKIRS